MHSKEYNKNVVIQLNLRGGKCMKKTWFITGVSSGFGYELTKQLLDKGNTVIGTVRNKEKATDFLS